MSIVSNIVGRAFVGDSNLVVCRMIWKGLNQKAKGKEFRNVRKELYREAIQTHKENYDLYYSVTRGNI